MKHTSQLMNRPPCATGCSASLRSPESATSWARAALAAKNTLTTADAKLLEDALRPVDYSAEIGAMIFDRLYDEGIRSICADPDMPDKATFYRWLREHKEFRKIYAFACTWRADDLCDDIYDILFEEPGETVELVRGGQIVTTSPSADDLALRRIRINVRKWVITALKSHAELLEQKE
jgi:hypothetical protein